MDMRTGRIYDSKEDAIAAGVPESDLMQFEETVTASGKVRRVPFVDTPNKYANVERSTQVNTPGQRRFMKRVLQGV